MNKCLFVGRLTRDPESRTIPSGKTVCNFAIAVNEGKDANGNDRVVFVDFDAWEGNAEFVMKWFTKGKPIIVEARLSNDSWEDKTTGEKRSKAKFTVKEVNFVPTSPSNGGTDQAQNSSTVEPEPAKRTRKPRQPVAAAVEAPETGFTSDEGDDDEDIPF